MRSQSVESSSTMDNRFPHTSRMRVLAVLVGVSLVMEGPWTAGPLAGTWPLLPVAAWDQWDRADHPPDHRHWGSSPGPEDSSFDSPTLWDNLIGGAVPPGALGAATSWRADAAAVSSESPPTTQPPAHSSLACNFSDWRPVAAPWPDRLQESWDRVDVVHSEQQPTQTQRPKPFRPSQPLVERPAPAPVRSPAPPCYASIQLPRPTPAAASTATFQLLYSPDPLPSTAWDAKAETSRCLWTLVAPPGHNVSAAVSMGAWGSGRGALHLYAQAADGELQPVFSLRAPAQSSAEVHTHSSVAVLATALPASATFTLRVRVSAATAATGPQLADTLQPPPGQQRPWGETWEGSKPGSGSSSWRPKPYPYPASNVDVEAIDLTHQHQAANCEVQQQQQQRPAGPAGAGMTTTSTPTPPRDEDADDDEPPVPGGTPATPPAPPQRPAATGNNKPSTSTARPSPSSSSPPPSASTAAPAAGAATTTTATTSSRGPPPAKGTAGAAGAAGAGAGTTAKPGSSPSSVNKKP